MKKYTRQQIQEAITYWKKQLSEANGGPALMDKLHKKYDEYEKALRQINKLVFEIKQLEYDIQHISYSDDMDLSDKPNASEVDDEYDVEIEEIDQNMTMGLNKIARILAAKKHDSKRYDVDYHVDITRSHNSDKLRRQRRNKRQRNANRKLINNIMH